MRIVGVCISVIVLTGLVCTYAAQAGPLNIPTLDGTYWPGVTTRDIGYVVPDGAELFAGGTVAANYEFTSGIVECCFETCNEEPFDPEIWFEIAQPEGCPGVLRARLDDGPLPEGVWWGSFRVEEAPSQRFCSAMLDELRSSPITLSMRIEPRGFITACRWVVKPTVTVSNVALRINLSPDGTVSLYPESFGAVKARFE